MAFPRLPARAAYINLSNPHKRNALSLAVLRDLRRQLHFHLKCPVTGEPVLLPPFQPDLIDTLEAAAEGGSKSDDLHAWLTHAPTWRRRRADQPRVLVLRSEGPVFSSGHDLAELSSLSRDEVHETFALCAEVMSLIRRSPAVVVAPVQGLATAAGFQLAMTADLPIALGDTKFQLPGMGIGLPCTSPAVAVSRRVSPGLAYRMFATAESVTAAELGAGVLDVVPVPEHAESTDTRAKAFEERVASVVGRLVETSGQAQALGKWAFWTQLGMRGGHGEGGGADGYEDAVRWAGRAMALHARSEDAKEGITAWREKRRAEWKT
ncbi:ClpP/crotonase [Cryphonectria parasitica EP155]|uniref:Enoyl-CoA hydratase domain-containing protein 3, mitochondrial n=1 Tax=Cryphonectria parasitica (strain ATCC 38755 / EP155) TaxID=660469 RepID=A0A9P4XYQ1_CRYP1|nr:ClpP/crotonase [Cryphonectria parasitica EP155]KAF3763225.1 ClpP/crotonase [Cryphonectria parasitica EP155]